MTVGAGAGAAPSTRVLAPLRLPSAVDEVVDRLLGALALGEFVPGERLPAEREMAKLLGVSRNTVHEAFSRLRTAGVVEVRRGRTGGAVVLESWNHDSAAAVSRALVPRSSELEELCDLRCRFEEVVARTAAERRTPTQARELRRLVAAFASAGSAQVEHAADMAIHEAVLSATRNPQMAALSHDLLARVSLGLRIEPYERRFFHQAVREHTALVEAVVQGRVEDAGALAREHFTMSTRTLRAVIRRGSSQTEETAEE
jgi:GntR family transcriptional repressor for pyruvate dehydrogenase complex